MKEFNCKATSTWSKCGQKQRPLRTANLEKKRQEWKAQLDYIVGPRGRNDDAYIYNDVKLWESLDHCPTHEDTGREKCRKFSREEEKGVVDWMEAEDRSAKKSNSRKKGDGEWRR